MTTGPNGELTILFPMIYSPMAGIDISSGYGQNASGPGPCTHHREVHLSQLFCWVPPDLRHGWPMRRAPWRGLHCLLPFGRFPLQTSMTPPAFYHMYGAQVGPGFSHPLRRDSLNISLFARHFVSRGSDGARSYLGTGCNDHKTRVSSKKKR